MRRMPGVQSTRNVCCNDTISSFFFFGNRSTPSGDFNRLCDSSTVNLCQRELYQSARFTEVSHHAGNNPRIFDWHVNRVNRRRQRMARDCSEYKYSAVYCDSTIVNVVMRCLRAVSELTNYHAIYAWLRESRKTKLNDEIVKVLPTYLDINLNVMFVSSLQQLSPSVLSVNDNDKCLNWTIIKLTVIRYCDNQ